MGEIELVLSLCSDGDGDGKDDKKEEEKIEAGDQSGRPHEENHSLGHIDAFLNVPTIEWDKNDVIFTKIPLEPQPVNFDYGFKFVWKLKRLYGFKYDMRDAKLDVNIFAHDSNSLYPFNDEIKCTISWQTIYMHEMSLVHDGDGE